MVTTREELILRTKAALEKAAFKLARQQARKAKAERERLVAIARKKTRQLAAEAEAKRVRLAAIAKKKVTQRRQKKVKAALKTFFSRCVRVAIDGKQKIALTQAEIDNVIEIQNQLGLATETKPWLSQKQEDLVLDWDCGIEKLVRGLAEFNSRCRENTFASLKVQPKFPSLIESVTTAKARVKEALDYIGSATQIRMDSFEEQVSSAQVNIADIKKESAAPSIRNLLAATQTSPDFQDGMPMTLALIEGFHKRREEFEKLYVPRIAIQGGFRTVGFLVKTEVAKEILLAMGYRISNPHAFFPLVKSIVEFDKRGAQLQWELGAAQKSLKIKKIALSKIKKALNRLTISVAYLENCLASAATSNFDQLLTRQSAFISRDGKVTWATWGSARVGLKNGHPQELRLLRWLVSGTGQTAIAQLLDFLGSRADEGKQNAVLLVHPQEESIEIFNNTAGLKVAIPCGIDTTLLLFNQMDLTATCSSQSADAFKLTISWQ